MFGSEEILKMSLRFFRTLHDHLGAGTYDARLERDLQSAAGELAEVAGWLAYDAAEHELCRRMNQESLYFTRLAGDRTMELLTLQNSSMHAGSQGHPREALQIARSVLEGDYRLSPRLKALFLTRKARAMAQGGDGSALTLLPEIRSLFLDGVSDEDPAWAWWIDERELAWHEAMVQRDLGLFRAAIDHFERSVAATPADEITKSVPAPRLPAAGAGRHRRLGCCGADDPAAGPSFERSRVYPDRGSPAGDTGPAGATPQGAACVLRASRNADGHLGRDARMTSSDDEMAAQADPALGQHFLVSAEKLSKLVAAAGIRPDRRRRGAGSGRRDRREGTPEGQKPHRGGVRQPAPASSPAECALRTRDPRRRT